MELDLNMALRYMQFVTGEDDPTCEIVCWHDAYPSDRRFGWMKRRVYGRLRDVWVEIEKRQRMGAGVFVTFAKTDGIGRKKANLVAPRCLWIESDEPIDENLLPLPPTVTLQTRRGRHYVWRISGLDWVNFDGLMRALLVKIGGDPNAIRRNQPMRLAGTFHLKVPGQPFLASIVNELTTGRAYTVDEIVARMPPLPEPRTDGSRSPAVKGPAQFAAMSYRQIASTFSTLSDLIALSNGQFSTRIHSDGDRPIHMDWRDYGFWQRCVMAAHHGSGGSREVMEFMLEAARGNPEMGLVGAPDKFDRETQIRMWFDLREHDFPVTMATVAFFIRELREQLGVSGEARSVVRRVPGSRPLADSARVVFDTGKIIVDIGLDRVNTAHEVYCRDRYRKHGAKTKLLDGIRQATLPQSGVAHIENLRAWAAGFGISGATASKYLHQLAVDGAIVKSNGKEASLPSARNGAYRGIVVALSLPEAVLASLRASHRQQHIDGTVLDQSTCDSRDNRPLSAISYPPPLGGSPQAEYEASGLNVDDLKVLPSTLAAHAPLLSIFQEALQNSIAENLERVRQFRTADYGWWREIGVIGGAAGAHLDAYVKESVDSDVADAVLQPIARELQNIATVNGSNIDDVQTAVDEAVTRAVWSVAFDFAKRSLPQNADTDAIKAARETMFGHITIDTMPADWRRAFKEALIRKLIEQRKARSNRKSYPNRSASASRSFRRT